MQDGLLGFLAQYSLGVNLFSLGLACALAWWAYRRNNLIALLYWAAFIFLVIGQAVHASVVLQNSPNIQYIGNFVSREGHGLGSACLLIIVLLIAYFEAFHSLYKFRSLFPPVREKRNIQRTAPSLIYYAINAGGFLLVAALLVRTTGGVKAWISEGRPGGMGATVFIVSLGMFTFPLILKLAFNLRPALSDWLLFGAALAMKLSVSRLLSLFDLVLLLFVFVYSRSMQGEVRVVQRYKTALLSFFAIAGLMFFGFGSYRHISPQIGSSNPIDVIAFVWNHPSSSLFSLDLNYRISVEGYSGFAGALTEFVDRGELKADFGISLLSVFTQVMPAWIRELFGGIPELIYSYYWWPISNVGGALEGFLVHFSFLGVLLYPIAFYFAAYGIHERLMKQNGTRLQRGLTIVVLCLIGAYGLNLVRGSTRLLFVYWIAELIIAAVALIIFLTFHRIPSSSAARAKGLTGNA